MVVEGYMDVVALAQFGIGYSVATLGTATSKEHIDRLYRLVPQIVFSFDGDSAGRSAAWKALLVTLVAMSDGRSAKFLFLPDGDDPDTLIRKEGKDKFELRLERATPLDEFFFSNLESDLDMDSMEGKATLSKLAMPLLSSIPEGVFKQLMIDALAGKTGLEASRLIQAAGQGQNTATSRSARPPQGSPVYEKRVSEGPGLAELALSMLVQQPELSQEFEDSSYEQLRQNPDARFFGEIALAIRQHELLSPGLLLGHFQGKTEFKSLRSAMDQEQLLDVSELREEFKGTVSTLLDRFETQLKQELKKQLINKPFAELNPEERQLIRDNTNPKSQL
jgi:DNA primase